MKKLALGLLAFALVAGSQADARPGQPGRLPGPIHRPGPGRPGPGRPLPPPPGRQDEIVRLGGTQLSPITDADTITVNSCDAGDAGRISSIRIHAVKHSSRIDGVRVTYGNLNSDDITLNESLSPGQSTEWIDLQGRGRCVQSIRVFGRSRSIGFKKAEIEIYGLRQWRSQLDLQDRREEN